MAVLVSNCGVSRRRSHFEVTPSFRHASQTSGQQSLQTPAAKRGKGGVEPKKKEAMEDDGIFPSSDSDGGKSQYQRVKDVMFFSDILEV